MPWFKGVFCSRVNHLGWRESKEGDLDTRGDQKESHELCIVKLKDCEFEEKNGHRYYIPDNAPSIPTSNGGSWYGYGKQRKNNGIRWFWVENPKTGEKEKVRVEGYFTTPFYAVRDAIVYQGTIRHYIPSLGSFMTDGLSYEEACKKYDEYKDGFNSKYFGSEDEEK